MKQRMDDDLRPEGRDGDEEGQTKIPSILMPDVTIPLEMIVNQLPLRSVARLMRTCKALNAFCLSHVAAKPYNVHGMVWNGGELTMSDERAAYLDDVEQLRRIPVTVHLLQIKLLKGFTNDEEYEIFLEELAKHRVTSVGRVDCDVALVSGEHLERFVESFKVMDLDVCHAIPKDIFVGPIFKKLRVLTSGWMFPNPRQFLDKEQLDAASEVPDAAHGISADVLTTILQEWCRGERNITSVRFFTSMTPEDLHHTLSLFPTVELADAFTAVQRPLVVILAPDHRLKLIRATDRATLFCSLHWAVEGCTVVINARTRHMCMRCGLPDHVCLPIN